MIRTISKILTFTLTLLALAMFAPDLAHCADDSVSTHASVGKTISKIVKKIAKSGVKSIPSTSSSVSSSSSSSSIKLNGFDPAISSVSGTPPTLAQLAASSSIDQIFWRAGVVAAIGSGAPNSNPAQCMEFFSANSDGSSGGLGACHMAEGMGESFEVLLNSEKSICYLKNLPTKANFEAGGITLDRGSFPNNRVDKLFAPGDGHKKRIIKINVPEIQGKGDEESVFVQIPTKASNDAEDFAYRANIYFCSSPEAEPRGFNTIRVKIKDSSVNLKLVLGQNSDPFGGGSSRLLFDSNLSIENGVITFNRTSKRKILMNHKRNDQDEFKANIEIRGDNRIYLKRMGTFQNGMQSNTHKDYIISKFTGSDVTNALFLEGAFKGSSTFGTDGKEFSGATEYRDTYYAAAPGSDLLAEVESIDFDSDPFFLSEPVVDVDTSDYSCSVTPHIEISMVAGNTTLEQSLAPCFDEEFKDMRFCREDSDVAQAEEMFHTVCTPAGPPPP